MYSISGAVVAGIQQRMYSVDEDAMNVTICASLAVELERTVEFTMSTISDTAIGKERLT